MKGVVFFTLYKEVSDETNGLSYTAEEYSLKYHRTSWRYRGRTHEFL